MTKSQEIMAKSRKYLANNYKPMPFAIVRGDGVWVWDAEGNKYMDMLSTYSANNLGHLDSRMVETMISQLGRLACNPRSFYNDKLADFGEAVANLSGMDKVLPKNTGAEAVESAILIARKWGYIKKRVRIEEDKAEIIVCNHNFHGRTMGSRSASSTQEYRKYFGPLADGFVWVPFGNANELEAAITKNTVAFLVEPILGEGGIIVPPEGYFKEVRRICNYYDILLVLDEVQTGFGRTGYDFAFEHEGIRPDLLVMAKALGGGVATISAVAGPREFMDIIEPGDDGSTFGGNPLACAAALKSIKILKEDNLSENSRKMGNYFIPQLKEIRSSLIKEVRGRGLMIGIELVKEAGGARKVCEELCYNGVLCYYTDENVIRISPPLIITNEHIDWAVEKIKEVLA